MTAPLSKDSRIRGFGRMLRNTLTLLLRPALRVLLLSLLVLIAWGAVAGGIRQMPRAFSIGQQLESWIQIVCGALSLTTLITCFWWRRLARPVRIAWAASLGLTAALSPVVWGPPMPLVGLMFAAVAALTAWAVIAGLRFAFGRPERDVPFA